MKNYKISDHLATINNYNFCDTITYTYTDRLYDRPGPEGQVGGKP